MEDKRPEDASTPSNEGTSQPPGPPPLPSDAQPPPLPSAFPPPLPPPLPSSGPPPLPPEAFPSFPPDEQKASPSSIAPHSPPPPIPPQPSVKLPPVPDNGAMLGWASLILGFLSLPIGGCCALLCMPMGFVSLVGGVIGAILGHLGMRKAGELGERNVPALIGLIVSILAVLLSVVWMFVGGFAMALSSM